jgi:hypothetical protein
MSSALSSFKRIQSRSKESQASTGARLAYNGVITEILPPIVAELEGKINELQRKVDHILDEMQWHPNAISRGTAYPALQAAAVPRNRRKTRRRIRK